MSSLIIDPRVALRQFARELRTTMFILDLKGYILAEDTVKLSDLLKEAYRFLVANNIGEHLQNKIEKVFEDPGTRIVVLQYDTQADPMDIDNNMEAFSLWNDQVLTYFRDSIAPQGFYFGTKLTDKKTFVGWFQKDPVYLCNHPGLVVINGCPDDDVICCKSCNKDTCEERCKSTDTCEHIKIT